MSLPSPPSIFGPADFPRSPPSTRYQGSKFKLLDWIGDHFADLEFDTALDAFGGSGCISYLLKMRGKAVTYNDYLRFNHWIGRALIENSGEQLPADAIMGLQQRDSRFDYDDLVARVYRDIFFTDTENVWLDTVCQNIPRLPTEFQQALAYYALFQACLSKRPYNLFHRKNLYMRTADVGRKFGNKATWDRPFPEHFAHFAAVANQAVFESRNSCRALCCDALDIPGAYDLVYIDPPYISRKGVGVDYLDFYHFLEGLVDYPNWALRIDHGRKHRPLRRNPSRWADPKSIHEAFARLFRRFAESTIVVSYRDDGIPSANELIALLRQVKSKVRCRRFGRYQYALSTNHRTQELLLIGH